MKPSKTTPRPSVKERSPTDELLGTWRIQMVADGGYRRGFALGAWVAGGPENLLKTQVGQTARFPSF